MPSSRETWKQPPGHLASTGMAVDRIFSRKRQIIGLSVIGALLLSALCTLLGPQCAAFMVNIGGFSIMKTVEGNYAAAASAAVGLMMGSMLFGVIGIIMADRNATVADLRRQL